VGTASRLWDGQHVVGFLLGARELFPILQNVQTSPPLSLLINEYLGSFAGVKQVGRAAECWPAPSAKVKNEQGYTSTPAICTHGRHRIHVYNTK